MILKKSPGKIFQTPKTTFLDDVGGVSKTLNEHQKGSRKLTFSSNPNLLDDSREVSENILQDLKLTFIKFLRTSF